MPFLQIDLWKGFDEKKKEILVAKLTEVVTEVVDCPKEAVHIIIREEPKQNWAVGGVQLSKKFGT